jgi:acetamidase/formamidase
MVEPVPNPGSWSNPTKTRFAPPATSRMVDLLMRIWGFTDVHAYILCSVAMHLRLRQVVNEPMITVSASIAKQILPERRLF